MESQFPMFLGISRRGILAFIIARFLLRSPEVQVAALDRNLQKESQVHPFPAWSWPLCLPFFAAAAKVLKASELPIRTNPHQMTQ